jgi:hypothetical protein
MLVVARNERTKDGLRSTAITCFGCNVALNLLMFVLNESIRENNEGDAEQ